MQTKALALAAQGFEVFPLIPHGKPPAIKDWQHKATADPATIKLWWPEGSVKNIGIHCKDLCVIDVDVKKTNGYVEFKKLPVSPTKISQTTSGGCHVLYRLPAGTKIKNQVNFRPGIDIRTEGGFIVAPGSIINNKEYFWANDRPVAMIPLPLLELLSPGAAAASDFGHVPVSAALTGKVPAGSRDDMVYKMCCSWRAQNLTWEQAGVKLGELWPSIEQPPDDPFTWAEACAKLTQAWRHPAGTAATQLAAQEWEKPISLEVSIVPELKDDLLPGILGEMTRAVSTATETPLELAVGLVLPVIATACQGKASVQVNPGYQEPVNIWTVTALDPGNRKSSVLTQMTAPLNEWEKRKRLEMEPVINVGDAQE